MLHRPFTSLYPPFATSYNKDISACRNRWRWTGIAADIVASVLGNRLVNFERLTYVYWECAEWVKRPDCLNFPQCRNLARLDWSFSDDNILLFKTIIHHLPVLEHVTVMESIRDAIPPIFLPDSITTLGLCCTGSTIGTWIHQHWKLRLTSSLAHLIDMSATPSTYKHSGEPRSTYVRIRVPTWTLVDTQFPDETYPASSIKFDPPASISRCIFSASGPVVIVHAGSQTTTPSLLRPHARARA